MRKKGKHFSWTDRIIIEKLYNRGVSQTEIAKELECVPSAVCKEVKRGMCQQLTTEYVYVWKYSAEIAQYDADSKSSAKGCAIKLGHNYNYAYYIAEQVKQGIAPDAIVGSLRRAGKWTVCTTTLYTYIDRGYIPGITNKDLWEKPNRKRSYHKVKASRAPAGKSIERRPKAIADRAEFGHWEMDTVIGKAKGKRQALLVLTERKSRMEIVRHMRDKSAKSVVSALSKLVRHYPKSVFKTITVDNGTEFSDAASMENLGIDIYYCHPYTSCERGSNERQNRIIRRFFPKGMSLANVPRAAVQDVEYRINHIPRRILNYACSEEIFNVYLTSLMSCI